MHSRLSREIVCFTRYDNGEPAPAELLSGVETASRSPLKIIKDIERPREIKRTLKVSIAPWGDLCLFEYRWNTKRILLSPFRLSRGRRIWAFYDDLKRNNVSVPEPVIFLEIKRSVFVTKTYLATRWIEGGFSIGQLAVGKIVPHPDNFESILCRGVDVIVNLHNSGFIHGDLNWYNLLVFNGNQDIVLTDLDSIRKSSSVSMQGRDFGRFLIPPAKYQLGQETTEMLIEWYLRGRNLPKTLLEKSIRRYVARKKE